MCLLFRVFVFIEDRKYTCTMGSEALRYLGCQGLLKHFPQIDKIAAIKSQRFEKGQHIGGVPANRGVNILDSLGFVILEYFLSQTCPDAHSHKIRIYAQSGDPGAFGHPETGGEDVADHKTDDLILVQRNKAGAIIPQGMRFNNPFKIRIHRFSGDSCIDLANFMSIIFV